jgi:hypothetical protein
LTQKIVDQAKQLFCTLVDVIIVKKKLGDMLTGLLTELTTLYAILLENSRVVQLLMMDPELRNKFTQLGDDELLISMSSLCLLR